MSNEISRWAIAVRDSAKPAYVAIAEAIAHDIQSGRLAADQRLPTLRRLARSLKLNFTTVARGYAEAQRRGLIDTRAGSGTFVREMVRTGLVRRPISKPAVDMTMNMPPEPHDGALMQKLHDGLAALAHEADPYLLLRYQEFGGTGEDREAAAHWMATHVPGLGIERVLVSPGIQPTLMALCGMLASQPGDVIACEAVTYPGLKGVAAHLGIRLVGLSADDNGIDPGAFAALCASDLPKALYLNPTFNNPTTAILSQQRREAIAETARRYSVPIIEDDPYGCLPLARPTALAALVPQLTFYLTGFAKCLGAGLRIAYVATPNERYTSRLAAAMRTSSVMAPPMLVRLATRWVGDGTAAAAAAAIRGESMARQQIARDTLRQARYVTKPEAFHLWLDVPPAWNPLDFADSLRSQGVAAVAADAFAVSASPQSVRICLGGPTDREGCRRTLEILEEAIKLPPCSIQPAEL
jgi:DNA-binding transcriptional MocR family regulator